MDMIAIRNGRYDREGFALAMDFSVAPGSITAVLGPSGAGKSTVLNILAGFDALKSGNIILNGVDHTTSPPDARPINFVFQDSNSFAHLTARDNVALGIAPNLKLTIESWNTVDGALQHVGIAHLANRKPGDMSGGERQRIALARVLVRQKPILLLDEAFAALGPGLRHDMLLLLQRIQAERKLTVLMVTHHPDDAKLVSQHIMFIANGIVHAPQNTKAFFKSKNSEVLNYLGTQKQLPA
jgi:thiamine transport system ATP-binding protein